MKKTTKKQKVDLINKLVSIVGYEDFKVSVESSHERLDDVLGFCYTSYSALEDLLPEIDKLLNL